MDQSNTPLKLTLEDGQRSMLAHAMQKGCRLHDKYGSLIDLDVLERILKDDEFVRYPTKVVFSNAEIDEGYFAVAKKIEINGVEEYIIYIHEHYQQRLGDIPALVLYQLVMVNYGEFATSDTAEEFASAALGMKRDEYYEYICSLADQLNKG